MKIVKNLNILVWLSVGILQLITSYPDAVEVMSYV